MTNVESEVWSLFERYLDRSGDRQIAATLTLAHSNFERQPESEEPPKPTAEPDELLSLATLAKQLPPIRGDKPPSRNTLYTWATTGLKSRSGQPIKLDTQFVGGILCSSLNDVQRFFERKDDVDWSPPKCLSTQRERDAIAKRGRAAVERMRAKGI